VAHAPSMGEDRFDSEVNIHYALLQGFQMKKFILALMLLTGCDGSNNEALKQTRDDQVFTVDLRVIPENTVSSFCGRLGVKYDSNGCNSFNYATKTCTIYVAKPKYVADSAKFSIIGHELWHCRFGQFHE
jgi:hypothetical protein